MSTSPPLPPPLLYFALCYYYYLLVLLFCLLVTGGGGGGGGGGHLYRLTCRPEEILTVESPSTGFTGPSSKLTDRTNQTPTNGRTDCSVRTNQNTEITVSLSEPQYQPCVCLSVKAVSAWIL